MPQERDGSGTVIAQRGDRLDVDYKGQRLTVAMKGFPPGFELQPQSRVVLVDESGGTVARPLVRLIKSQLPPGDVEKRGPLNVAGRALQMQANTVVTEASATSDTKPGEYEVWVVERAGEEANQVIAVRRRR